MHVIRCDRESYGEICEGCESKKSKILYVRVCACARKPVLRNVHLHIFPLRCNKTRTGEIFLGSSLEGLPKE